MDSIEKFTKMSILEQIAKEPGNNYENAYLLAALMKYDKGDKIIPEQGPIRDYNYRGIVAKEVQKMMGGFSTPMYNLESFGLVETINLFDVMVGGDDTNYNCINSYVLTKAGKVLLEDIQKEAEEGLKNALENGGKYIRRFDIERARDTMKDMIKKGKRVNSLDFSQFIGS